MPVPLKIPAVDILGVPVSRLTMAETLAWIETLIREGKPGQVVTANAEILYRASQNPAYLSILRNAALVTPDGSGVLWASGYLGKPIGERVTGVDLLQALLPLAEEKEWRVYFLGARPEVLDLMLPKVLAQYPGLRVAGRRHGYFTGEEQLSIVEEIRGSGAHMLFAAMGFPRQEAFIARYLEDMGVRLAMGVGGSFDVLAGKAIRAPAWMSGRGLEWLYRLLKDPRRAGRMAALPKFVLAVWRQRLKLKA
jgi:N-acetylglucosaminyldiphosphoundecaprenol N-acetyl-beta-D-mannosaminyltransferase